MKLPVTAVVITRNEETNIVRCLQSLVFCEEVLVVDSESTDRTRELAEPYASRVIRHPWCGYAEQKNFANGMGRFDWILSVDADEVVSEALREEIRSVLETSAPDFVAFSVPRKTIHLGRWIQHGGWYPNRLVRLFRKSRGTWIGSELHERWEAHGVVGNLRNDLLHYSFRDLADQVARNNHYSTLGALRLAKEGKRFSPLSLFGKSLSKFLETYFLKRGFLDGYPGFIISVSAAYSVFLKWAKLWELQRDPQKS